MKTKSYRSPQEAYQEFISALASYLNDQEAPDGSAAVYFGDESVCADVFGSSIDELLQWPNSGFCYFVYDRQGTMQGCASFEEAVWAACLLAGIANKINWNECYSSKGGWHSIEWSIED